MARKRTGAHLITISRPDGEQSTFKRNPRRYGNGRGSVNQRSRDDKWIAALVDIARERRGAGP